jgi:hypothetical protein
MKDRKYLFVYCMIYVFGKKKLELFVKSKAILSSTTKPRKPIGLVLYWFAH